MKSERYEWQENAACRGAEPEVFFPVAEDDAWLAKQICERCTVRAECLTFSFANHERYGVWGGVTEKERLEMYRRGAAQRVLAAGSLRAG